MAKAKKLTVKQIESLKNVLIEESIRVRENVSTTKEVSETPISEAKDQVDSANDNILLNTKLRFTKRETLYLKKILKSLENIESGEYGECKECGDCISYQRLLARPTSDMCITCKEESEREENQNYFLRTSKSLSQTFTYSA